MVLAWLTSPSWYIVRFSYRKLTSKILLRMLYYTMNYYSSFTSIPSFHPSKTQLYRKWSIPWYVHNIIVKPPIYDCDERASSAGESTNLLNYCVRGTRNWSKEVNVFQSWLFVSLCFSRAWAIVGCKRCKGSWNTSSHIHGTVLDTHMYTGSWLQEWINVPNLATVLC